MEHSYKFSVSHPETTEFKSDGLRPFFEYRDLGICDATNGAYVAHVIRAKPGVHTEPTLHHHAVGFQMVYVLKGWVKFHYDGVGEVTLKAGSCVHQPPGIKHIEISHSDDLELIEIVAPAEFETVTHRKA